jgi:hypothetical protein
MKKIDKAKLIIETDFLQKKVKEIKFKRDLEMAKKLQKEQFNKDLPIALERSYNAIFDLIKILVKKDKLQISQIYNLILVGVKYYKDIPKELDEVAIKEYLIGKFTSDILELIRPVEERATYGIEYLIKAIELFITSIQSIIESKDFDYTETVSNLLQLVSNYKDIYNEFADLDNKEIGELAEYISLKLIK